MPLQIKMNEICQSPWLELVCLVWPYLTSVPSWLVMTGGPSLMPLASVPTYHIFFSFLWTISEILWLKIKTCNICLLLDHNSEMECWVGRHLEVWLWLCSASNSWVHYSLEILQTILKTRPIKHALLCNIQFWTATLENKYDPRFMVEYVWFVCARPSYGLYEMLSLNFSESLPSIMINGYSSIMFCQHT